MLTTFGCLALLGSGFAMGGDPIEETAVVNTTLTAIRQTPESFKSVWVRFPVQFSAVGRLQNPFFTRFVASDFTNFHAWADEQPIWRRDAYDDVFGLLFMSKQNESLQTLISLDRFQRIEVVGIVRNTFQGMPWIEVSSFTPIESRVDTPTLSHLYRGEQHMLNRRWTRAVSELSLAPVEGVPAHVRAAVHQNLGVCYLRMGESDNALSHLETANSLNSKNPETQRLLTLARSNPSAGLDRVIKQDSLKDSQRPLWEAFAPVRQPATPTPSPNR